MRDGPSCTTLAGATHISTENSPVLAITSRSLALAVVEPDLFEFEMMAGDVETEGELTRGACVFDRRDPAEWRDNMEVAVSINADSARQFIIDRLMMSGNLT